MFELTIWWFSYVTTWGIFAHVCVTDQPIRSRFHEDILDMMILYKP